MKNVLYLFVFFATVLPSVSFSAPHTCSQESIQKVFYKQEGLLYDEFFIKDKSIDSKLHTIRLTVEISCVDHQSKCKSQDIKSIVERGREQLLDSFFISDDDIYLTFRSMVYDVAKKCDVLPQVQQHEPLPCFDSATPYCS